MTTQGINPIPNLIFSRKAIQDPTTYAANIDAAITALTREAGRFSPMTWPGRFGAQLKALIGPGHVYDGASLTEVGCRTTGNFTSGNPTISSVGNTTGVAIGMAALCFTFSAVSFTANTSNGSNILASPSSLTGLFIGMPVYGPGIPPGATISTTTPSLTISANATATATGATILSTGLTPLATASFVTGVTATSITLNTNALSTVTGGYVFICQPIGTTSTGNLTSGSPIVTNIPSTRGMFAGMPISGTNIPGSTTVLNVLSDTSITMSANASGPGTGTVIDVNIPVPASNSRIDYLVLDQATGRASWVAGTVSATPAVPALPAGQLPCAQLLVPSGLTSIGSADASDVRDLTALGLKSGAYTAISLVPTIAIGLSQGQQL